MTDLGPMRIGTLAFASLLFVLMYVILETKVYSPNSFKPQAPLAAYTYAQLADFGSNLSQSARVTYRLVLVYLDTAFILLFSAWVFASFWGSRFLWVGGVLACLFAGFDLFENFSLIEALCLDGPCAAQASGDAISPIYYVSLVKIAAFLLCLVGGFWVQFAAAKRAAS